MKGFQSQYEILISTVNEILKSNVLVLILKPVLLVSSCLVRLEYHRKFEWMDRKLNKGDL